MRNSPQSSWNVAAKRCAVCDGQFGLMRHYSWRTALCSKKCVGRFKARQEGDHGWLRRLHSAAWQGAMNYAQMSRRSEFRSEEVAQ